MATDTNTAHADSVVYETELLLKIDGHLRRVTMGEYIDEVISGSTSDDTENHPNDTTLAYLRSSAVEVLSCTESGRVEWKLVEAVTRHPVVNADGSDTLLKVLLHSGREVTATKGKSFLKRVGNKIVGVDGASLVVGDRLPVSTVLPGLDEVEFLNIKDHLSPSKYIYMSEVQLALACRRDCGRTWWLRSSGSAFNLPYPRSDTFLVAFVGVLERPALRQKNCHPECVYPFSPGGAVAGIGHLKEQLPLDALFGFFVGAYLSEGNCTKYAVMITNLDADFNAEIDAFCKVYSLNYHIQDDMKNGGRSYTLRIHSTVLAQLFIGLFGTGAANKRIPAELLAAPEAFLKGLVNGYFSSDGHVHQNGNMLSAYSASRGLLEDLQQLLLRFGIESKYRQMTENVYANMQLNNRIVTRGFTLFIHAAASMKFQSTFKLTIKRKQARLQQLDSKLDYFKDDIVPDVNTSEWGTISIHRSDVAATLEKARMDEDRAILVDILEEDVSYDRIVSIAEVANPHPWVYDLTVQDTRTFNTYAGVAMFDTFHKVR
jgi:DNA-directed RNA polymerase subunit A"